MGLILRVEFIVFGSKSAELVRSMKGLGSVGGANI